MCYSCDMDIVVLNKIVRYSRYFIDLDKMRSAFYFFQILGKKNPVIYLY